MKRRSLALLLAILLLPGASAEVINAQRAGMAHGEFEADLGFLAMEVGSSRPDVDLSFEADHVAGIRYEREAAIATRAPTPSGASLVATTPPDTYRFPVDVDDVRAVLAQPGSDFSITVKAADRGTLDFHLLARDGSLRAIDDPVWDFGLGVRDDADGFTSSEGRDTPWFNSIHRPGAWVHGSTPRAEAMHAVIAGDMVIELTGGVLMAETGQGVREWDARDHRETYAGTDPGIADAEAYSEIEGFLRLTLTGARLLVSTGDLEGEIDWLSQGTRVRTDGVMALDGAVMSDGGVLQERAHLVSDEWLLVHPIGGKLVIEEAPPTGFAATTVQTVQSVPPWVSVTMALVVVAGLFAFALRRRLDPTIEEIEAQIAAGRFARAARLARRRIRSDPQDESAVVARAVAMTRSGRHRDVVRELRARMAHHRTKDGVLTFLLGRAELHVGDEVRARRTLKRAVAYTPALSAAARELVPDLEHTGDYA